MRTGLLPTARFDTGRSSTDRTSTDRFSTGRFDMGSLNTARSSTGRSDMSRLNTAHPSTNRLRVGRFNTGRPNTNPYDTARLDRDRHGRDLLSGDRLRKGRFHKNRLREDRCRERLFRTARHSVHLLAGALGPRPLNTVRGVFGNACPGQPLCTHGRSPHCLNTRSSCVCLCVLGVGPVFRNPRVLNPGVASVDGLDHRFRCGRGDLVAPGALGAGQEEEVFVLGGGLGEVGVRGGCGNARLLHRACVLRQPLARDLAGVGHAYPSPIG
ncbi:hypothetical protein ABZX85_22820 [Streptomyces sp. NPDC004539]|uniref:hypothetical protein n=1 Tax=Streptomyces sp. NPDC004539 TaxID=3154280 RepID=UPI0033A304A5